MQSTNDALGLRGERVGLRARRATDVPLLQSELHDGDVVGRSRASGSPWLPQSADVDDLSFAPQKASEHIAVFSIVELASGELAGAAVLSLIDLHNRSGNVGLSLLPAFRGRGLAVDAVRVLSEYGFATRGLNRLQIGTLADNDAMVRTALAAGFAQEGVIKEAAWVNGSFVDEVLFGRLSPYTH